MFPISINMNIWNIFFIMLLSVTYAQDRKLISILNPNCDSCKSNNVTLVYTQAIGAKDVIHQIWDFTRGMPTVIYAVGSPNSSLVIEWDKSKPRRFNFSEELAYSFALVLDQLTEYNDIDNSAEITDKCARRSVSLQNVSWERKDSSLTDQEAMVQLRSTGFGDAKRSGVINIKLDQLPNTGASIELPHLIHTANSTFLDISIVNMTTFSEYNSSRFAFHMLFISTDSAADVMKLKVRKSLDDEHTPGVFEIFEVLTPGPHTGYIQLRPVAYQSTERGVTTSTNIRLSNFKRTEMPHASTVNYFYDHFDKSNLLVDGFFVSTGEPGDGFYKQHNYTAWSYTMGYGNPPTETFSLFVTLVISIGLAVPVLLALSGIIFVVRRRCVQRNERRRLIEDE